MEQLTLDPRDWSNLPTPKIRRGDRSGVYSWTKFYTAFSERFAIAALRLLGPPEGGVVLDPFCGVGTSLIASAKLGYPAVGVDLDPFSALISRAAFATEASPPAVQSMLAMNDFSAPKGRCDSTETSFGIFRNDDWLYATAILKRILGDRHSEAKRKWHLLLRSLDQSSDSEVVALTALGLAAGRAAKLAQGSNPVWYRRTEPGESVAASSINRLAIQFAEKILADLRDQNPSLRTREVIIMNGDFQRFDSPTQSIDLVLTSPPYLNRLDYVINHLAPLSLFSSALDFDVEDLRKSMLGTNKIVVKSGEPMAAWGESALRALNQVACHPSKASDTYYYWVYFDYFGRLFERLHHLATLLHARSRVLVVIQNSFYKDLEIPLPRVLLEMADSLSLAGAIVRSENVRAHLGTLSPLQVSYVPSKILREDVILLHPKR